MENKYIIVLIVITVYLFALLIAGLLAWKYGKLHKPFKESLEAYQQSWKKYKQEHNFDNLLKPMKVGFNLPEDELIYYVEENRMIITDKKNRDLKEMNKIGITRIDKINGYYDDPDFINFKSDYKLFLNKNKQPIIKQIMYISNKRIIFDVEGEFTQVTFDKIINSYLGLIYEEGNYQQGYIIHADEKLYKVISSHPEVTLVINNLKAKQEAANDTNK